MWQLALIDRELDEVLRCAAVGWRAQQQPAAAAGPSSREGRQRKHKPRGGSGETVERRDPDEGEPCPICYEELDNVPEAELVWCQHGCGHNIHGRCLVMWAEHQTTLERDLTCPMCRASWGVFEWTPPRRAANHSVRRDPHAAAMRRSTAHYGVTCRGCRAAPIVGTRYRCAICAHFDLCGTCFACGTHPEHPFLGTAHSGGSEEPAERPDPTPTPEGQEGPTLADAAAALEIAAEGAGRAPRPTRSAASGEAAENAPPRRPRPRPAPRPSARREPEPAPGGDMLGVCVAGSSFGSGGAGEPSQPLAELAVGSASLRRAGAPSPLGRTVSRSSGRVITGRAW